MPRTTPLGPALALVAAVGCADRAVDVAPVGAGAATVTEQTRFVRRLYLDLTGAAPAPDELDAALVRLAAAGSGPTSRGALADELLARPEFAATFVGELQDRLFAGQPLEQRYQESCGILRAAVPECFACAPPVEDQCADCACELLTQLVGERELLRRSAADLAAGEATGALERRYGGSQLYRFTFFDPGLIAFELFDQFLGKPAEEDELRNAVFMIFGALVPGGPAGLLFHRHGSRYEDLIDILFTSEVYREAAVGAVFQRYLGRAASPAELRAFTAPLDAAAPDVRPVIRAVVSSREYLLQ